MATTSNLKNNTSQNTVWPPGSTVGGVQPLTVGQVFTTSNTGGFQSAGLNGTSWSNPNDNVMVVKNKPPELEVKGRMVINGRDLEDRLDTIEKVLQIPERDVILERKHPKLREMYYDYINELAKYRMWHAIKGKDD